MLATRNEGKVRELRQMLQDLPVEVLSLKDFPGVPEVEEDGGTFRDNALKKAREVSRHIAETVLADDSGLEVDALGGLPGIHSARYAGAGANDAANNAKLLKALEEVPREKRGAVFRCVLVLYSPDGRSEVFEGSWRGEILFAPRGALGFGYDPLFLDPGQGLTAAELPPERKNRISHRGQAFAKFREWLLTTRS
ncbi:MAG: dITP/XTP pyrophosphatase [Syntrophaceae bacterium PtaB.Bin038]|nr:MAG: dITP/XTP pyrophosphatase [Syntrophaceae bacterium PtaB.Bin038]